MVKKNLIYFFIPVLLVVGFLVGVFLPVKTFPKKEVSDNNLSFINKTVTADIGKYFIINFQPLRQQFLEIQKKYPVKTYTYFVYLNNAAWVGVNERELFTAASTVKVPLAMFVYKMAEKGNLNLSSVYTLEELDLNDTFGDLYKVGADNQFTIEELVKIMLEKSDNTAANALYKILNRIGIDSPLDDVYNFMGWEFNEFGKKPDYEKIHLKILSNMFLTLYNAEYVNVEHSNKILEYLANTPFDDKIAAGLPAGVQVSHKIGVASNQETFSDCGIVYAPNRHYVLCLGSNGGDEKMAAKFMAEVSAAVYDYVINN